MNAARLCTREVVTCSARITLAEAAATMRAEHAGDLVVVREQDGQRWPAGILTDRDIVVAVVGQDAEPDALLVGELMSEPVAVAHGGDDLWLVARRMRQHGVRRLPVVGDAGELLGIVTLDDLLRAAAELLDELRLVAARQVYFEQSRHP